MDSLSVVDRTGTVARTLTLVLADDHHLFRESLTSLLMRAPEVSVVHEAADLDEALHVAARIDRLDALLLDLKMPGMNGAGGVSRAVAALPGVPVLIVSGELTPELARAALDNGAMGCVPKTVRVRALLSAIELVRTGERYVPEIALAIQEPVRYEDNLADGGADGSPLARLTPRERQVMALLVHGMSNKQIANHLDVQEITVKLHLTNVFRKLGVGNRTQAVRRAFDLGWKA